MTTIEIKHEIFPQCDTCGEELTEVTFCTTFKVMRIKPCKNCIAVVENDSFAYGYDNGYSDGYRVAKAEDES
jgi:hypothetical protein